MGSRLVPKVTSLARDYTIKKFPERQQKLDYATELNEKQFQAAVSTTRLPSPKGAGKRAKHGHSTLLQLILL
jgi:hypothetical protein